VLVLVGVPSSVRAQARQLEVVDVEGQPLSANVLRLLDALEFLGASLPQPTAEALRSAAKSRDFRKLQQLLDPLVLLAVKINPEARVKVSRGPGPATLQQFGHVPVLVKVVNDGTVTKPLSITSPQSGPIYTRQSAWRMGPDGKYREDAKRAVASFQVQGDKDRFLQVEMFTSPPLTDSLSGLKVEYAVALIYSEEAGKREATLSFDVGQGSQDLGFRAEVPILFDVKPGIPVKLNIRDVDGTPTTARLTFRDHAGRVYPPQAKRLAPDLFFEQQIYRADGDTVLLPPGAITMTYGRGPEYKQLQRNISIPQAGPAPIDVRLVRWINAMAYGFYCGDHHIHAAGCAHYTSPTEGILDQDMFLRVKGEGLNVGCLLTWGPCFEFQRQFFQPTVNRLSEPFTVMKYDIEISGFGSDALGHVVLLNLRDQTYPGSDGTKTRGWPTWTTPVLRWAKAQGAVTGYAHSAEGLGVNPSAAAQRLLRALDANRDGKLDTDEAANGLLPETFTVIDQNKDRVLSEQELSASHARQANRLPNLAIPEMNSVGAQEICVAVAQGACDFISSMNTSRVAEWNCWYHIMNCGFPLKVSGETDFPCISGARVGQGRVYVQLGNVGRVDFGDWCQGIAKGRSYVCDGYAHALEFKVGGQAPGYDDIRLAQPGTVTARAKVAFASETPLPTAFGGQVPKSKTRLVELVVNGVSVASKEVPADDRVHDLSFEVPIERSSWVALRHFPQLHTNPVNVLVGGHPIRASRKSAQWCVGVIEQLWRVRGAGIAEHERPAAQRTFLKAIEQYKNIAKEAPEGS